MSYSGSETGRIRCKRCNYEFGTEGIEIKISEPICQTPALGRINNAPFPEPPAQGKIQCPICGYAWMIHSGKSSFYEA